MLQRDVYSDRAGWTDPRGFTTLIARSLRTLSRDGANQPDDSAHSWAARWFEVYPRPCLMLTRRLVVLGMNNAATTLLQHETALVVRDGVLSTGDRKAQAVLDETMMQASIGAPLRRVLTDEGAIYVLKFVALGPDEGSPVTLTVRSTDQGDLVCADLSGPFGLTPGEQRIVERLLRGASSQEIADALGKSVLTVRTHIKRAYAKLSVTTREQLFARLLPFLDA